MHSISKFNTKSKFTISMETTSTPEIFQPNAKVTPDGRTREELSNKGEVDDIYDVLDGSRLKQNTKRR